MAKPSANALAKEREELLLDKTEAFCRARLNRDYERLCTRLIKKMARMKPVPFLRGDINVWAAGIINALGSINYLFDQFDEPSVRQTEIAEFFGVRAGTVSQRATAIRDLMEMDDFESEYLTKLSAEKDAAMRRLPVEWLAMEMKGALSRLGAVPGATKNAPNFFQMRLEPGEFIDSDHTVMPEYYDVMEELTKRGLSERIVIKLRLMLERDPDFYDPYVSLAEIFSLEGDKELAGTLVDAAYDRAVARLTAETGEWPRRLEWGWLENRHILRLLSARAMRDWVVGRPDDALQIFRRLLAMDADDPMGIRVMVLALRMNLSSEEFGEKFLEDGDQDESEQDVEEWFEQNAPKFPEEFAGWFKRMQETGDPEKE